MADTEGSTIQGRNVYIAESGFEADSVTAGVGRIISLTSPTGDGTAVLSSVVPADGAELLEATFTVHSAGTGGSTQQWSIADASSTVLATMAATLDTTAAGTVTSLTMGTATNGKNIATTAGAQLTLTNTAVGTSTEGTSGIFRLVWAL